MASFKNLTFTFDKNAIRKQLLERAVALQTQKLIEYAEKESFEMLRYTAGMYYDDTFNMQDSLVWCVYYNGELKASGFPTPPLASEQSYLHAWSKPPLKQPVRGRELAEAFTQAYQPTMKKGWEVAWAATAPYAGYGEAGFTLHGKTVTFKVISQRYDEIKAALGNKCVVELRINVPKY